jgi:peptidyl-prolyl cis-trans isomerase D
MRRKEELRDQITDTLLGGLAAPAPLIDLLHGYRDETRTIEFITPDFDKLINVPEPDEAKLKDYYEGNKRQFTVPELRKLGVLALTAADVKTRIALTDEEIKAQYEADKEKYNIPEKRHILQLSFPDKAAAEAAFAELNKAKDFKDAASKLGFKESDFDLGLLARRDMIDPKIAAVAFDLKKDELSRPVEGQFTNALLFVSEIAPGKQRPLEEVKQEIVDRLAGERAAQEIQTLHDQIEDQRAAGKPLGEIAQALKLPFREIAGIDRNGRGGDGSPVADLPAGEAERIAQAAFAGSIGVEAEAAELADGGYAWVDVLAITPERLKPFEDVKGEVRGSVIEQERKREITARAGKLIERLTKGESMDALGKELGAQVERTGPVTRTTSPQGLTSNAVQQAFALPKDGATSALTHDGKGRTILRVVDIAAAPPPTPEQRERLKIELARQVQNDVLAQYMGALESRYGLSVNSEAIKQALGGPEGQPDTD